MDFWRNPRTLRSATDMKEITLRKYHRVMGLLLFLFLAVQTVTGLLFSLQYMTMPPLFDLSPEIRTLHYGWSTPGNIYRILLAVGTLIQAVFGLIIYQRIWSRSRRR
jgi:hypothetical protein